MKLHSQEEARILLGPMDVHARLLRDLLRVSLVPRGESLRLLGTPEAVGKARMLVVRALNQIRAGDVITPEEFRGWVLETVTGRGRRGRVEPRTPGQVRYMEMLRSRAMVFGIGPAGTGKTFLAVAVACECLAAGEYRKLVLTRPAVEAGEHLGFLPGDFQAKVNPYLRPLHDALGDILEPALARRYMESDVIEICPLAYMRGRTLNDAFIILDEGQNTTIGQMLMFLTRMGEHSRMVITGDVSQTDLPEGKTSGLVDAETRLSGIEGIGFVRLGKADIVRHALVQKIVRAYGDGDEREEDPGCFPPA